MEVSAVRQQILQTIERAKRAAADRRAANDEAGREYDVFLDQLAVPLFRQDAATSCAPKAICSTCSRRAGACA